MEFLHKLADQIDAGNAKLDSHAAIQKLPDFSFEDNTVLVSKSGV